MKWIKSSNNQWYADNGNHFLHITKLSGWYWVSRLDKGTEKQTTIRKYYRKLSEAKEASKGLI